MTATDTSATEPGGHAPAPPGGPLAGVRVLELATVLMGPYAAQILGDLGATVIKVEDRHGDPIRVLGGGTHPHLSGVSLNLLANRRSIALDLKHEQGREVVMRLLEGCDVLITNFRPDALSRLGVAYEDVVDRCPALVYCEGHGFRTDSPEGDLPAYDDIIQAMTGLPDLNATVGLGEHFVPTVLADKVSGMTITTAVLAALLHRQATGVGQRVEVPMFDTVLAFTLTEHLAAATTPGHEPGYRRVLGHNRGPHRTLDGHVVVMPYVDKHWRALFSAVGFEDKLDHPWFKDLRTRLAHPDHVSAELAGILVQRTTAEWLELCGRLGVPAAPVPTLDELVEDPAAHRGVLRPEVHPVVGPYRHIRQPIVFSATPSDPAGPAPLIGQDGVELLAEAGYDAEEIADLLDGGVVTVDPDRLGDAEP
ncbi:MAG TPA: CoA transferase [Acidimicrobiales bacterium]|nr:CoA transferase [Acidimicrobiales bacterium]